jgi:arginine decarboxylase
MHAAMIELDLTNLLHAACDVDPDPVLTPADTYQKLLRNGTEKIKFTEAVGRVTGVMLVPYPPGIPVRMPGERLGGVDSSTVRLILALQEFGKRFPGFEREVHGIEVDTDGDYWVRTVIDASGDSSVDSPVTIRATGQRKKPPTSAPPVKKRRPRAEKPKHPAHSGGAVPG